MSTKRCDLVVLGRKIGTATGCLQESRTTFHYDDFQPAEGCIIPQCSGLYILFHSGLVQWTDPSGEFTGTADIVFVVQDLPRIDDRASPSPAQRVGSTQAG